MFSSDDPRVSYLFTLRRNRHPLPRVWNAYFRGCPAGSYVVRVHADSSIVRGQNHTKDEAVQGEFLGKLLPHCIPVRRMEYSMAKSRLLLLRNASALRPAPHWHLYFSESCAPLVPCPKVHRFLQQHQGKSFVENRSPLGGRRNASAHSAAERGRPLSEVRRRMRHSNLPVSTYRETFGWIGLWHEHARALLAMEVENEPTFINTSLADEWYWPTLLAMKGMPMWERLVRLSSPLRTRCHGFLLTELLPAHS